MSIDLPQLMRAEQSYMEARDDLRGAAELLADKGEALRELYDRFLADHPDSIGDPDVMTAADRVSDYNLMQEHLDPWT